jgi:hypothetical protein
LSFLNFRGLETGSSKIRTCALPSGSNIELAYQHRDIKKQKVIDFQYPEGVVFGENCFGEGISISQSTTTKIFVLNWLKLKKSVCCRSPNGSFQGI